MREGTDASLQAPVLDEPFHRHLAVVLHVLGQEDDGHAAGAELALDAVAPGEGGGQTVC